MGHALAKQCFSLNEDIKNGSMNGLQKRKRFLLPKRWEKCVTSDGAFYEKVLSIILPNLMLFLFLNPHFILVHLVLFHYAKALTELPYFTTLSKDILHTNPNMRNTSVGV